MSSRRFVVLEHHWDGVHYDFMIEAGNVLRAWKLAEPPALVGAAQRASANFDHRLLYLDYEGPISGNRGHVLRWDAGTYDGDATAAGALTLNLHGQRLRGELHLRPVEREEWEWTLKPLAV